MPPTTTKVFLGWTLVVDGQRRGQSESSYGRASSHVVPVYDTIGKARAKATRIGVSHECVVEAYAEVACKPGSTPS